MVSLPFWKIYCLDFASANISLLELPSFQLILLDDVYSWHWLLCASPMIFSRSSILKGHEHLIWIIITYVWVLCFIMYLLSLYLFSRNVTKFTNCLQILGNYLLKATFWFTVEQFVQSIKSIHYLVKFFAWLAVMQFIHKSVVRVLFSVIQSTTKKSTYVMLH